ncbi:hypothetical protein [Flavobacterium laiguense]|uniref:Uncharacterized protein n=1 Tax=Flavobacterium laiguense TaxID=2169409 RepID=A0A2U1K1C7_9FLAO|nr:hypothetical protein [Flavobacterium laiguense]PWA10984.1 hypothetical protein DB891_03895 [Flavobacterium laiguense]
MALQTLNTIKNWFKTGLKPTQAQFWDTWDSFRHKSDKVPVAEIEGLNELLAGVSAATIYKPGQLLIFKRLPNENNSILEAGDLGIGIVENVFITGIYLGGDLLLLNFNIINQIDF